MSQRVYFNYMKDWRAIVYESIVTNPEVSSGTNRVRVQSEQTGKQFKSPTAKTETYDQLDRYLEIRIWIAEIGRASCRERVFRAV